MAAERDAELWLVRHGETEWSRDGRHTSTTDLDLTDERRPRWPARCRTGWPSARSTWCSPAPARGRCVPPSWPASPTSRSTTDLVEWDYGDYEGVTTQEIRETVPGWTVWTHPTPGGETAEQVTDRLDRVVARVREAGERVLVFGHGHSLRALTARWIEQPVTEGRFFQLDTATVSRLGYERDFPVVLSVELLTLRGWSR